ncbi:DUF7878 domain-containing protein [Saccharomonospora azurea]
MVRIRRGKITTADLNTEWSARGELLVHVEADISILDAGQELYSEILFPVLELASGLHDWVSADSSRRSNFEFESMSFEEVGVVRIVKFDSGWRVGSIYQPGLWSKSYSLDDIDFEVLRFTREVRAEAESMIGVDLSALFENR